MENRANTRKRLLAPRVINLVLKQFNMREIKFRAWDKVNKVILEVGTLFFETGGIKGFYKKDEHFLHESNYELMQYTGLKDKNGKEIYEGDIISMIGWSPENYRILFCDGGFAFSPTMKPCLTTDINMIEDSKGIHATIIGNIYENENLLKTV